MRKILFVVNNLGCNGAPLFAYSIVQLLRKSNIQIDILSYYEGILYDKLIQERINVEIINPEITDRDVIEKKCKAYDCVISFTICTYKIVQICCNLVPTIWYIHEGKNLPEYLKDINCKKIFLQKHKLWVVSEYVQQYIYEKWKRESEVIHNFVPDVWERYQEWNLSQNKINFLLMGSMIERKAYDVFLDSFSLLEEELRNRCIVHYAGEDSNLEYANIVFSKIKKHKNFINYGIVLDKEKYELFQKCDVAVVPSRDESCSLVVLEAAMMGKPVIITENVGAKYMVDSQNGWIIKVDDMNMLYRLLKEIIQGKYDLLEMGKQSRKKYIEYATEEQYREEFIRKVEEFLPKSRKMWNLCHWFRYKFNRYKDLYKESPFAEIDIPPRSRIVIYGAGKNGVRWIEKLKLTRYCKVTAWVDKYISNKEIISLEELNKISFDYILISVVSSKIQEEIRRELEERGIEREKILILK